MIQIRHASLGLLVIGSLSGCASSPHNQDSPPAGVHPTPVAASPESQAIQKAILTRLRNFRECYEKFAVPARESGKVIVEIVLHHGSERPQSVSLKSTTLNNQKVEECVLDEYRQLTFSSPEVAEGKDLKIIYPLSFRPVKK